jgi:prolyl-tRNA editing enzyme YbaK/EbsC (Cys-tRNA(Pro) deacylase)
MSEYEEKLKNIIQNEGIDAEHLSFSKSCHSVAEAAETVDAEPEDFVKSIVMVDTDENVLVGIVKGENRVSTKRVGKVLGIDNLRIASPDEILDLTGFPLGGTPGFGFDAVFLVDPKVMKKEYVYLGGGSDCALTYMSTQELVRANKGRVVRIRK